MSKYGDNLLFILNEAANAYKEQLEDGEIEIHGEDESGRECCCTIDLPELFGEALKEIESLRAQLDEAKALVLEEAAGYQDDIERYHQRALKAEAQLEAQSGEAVPDYLVTLRAMQLFDGEYVGQSRAPLWDWAYNKAAQEGEK